ncbi:hypothetical protein LRP52_45335 [Photobacterium sp. ZSDE20]|uniref:Uncharacterized protein n=1 Tax=Photobacterium pectinilyticum TaxID=2906793 RepID=A0ABT1N8V6_9GAMM|nr:hypothetical protein [Photobacterium sp. ZSDE20]MCQ1061171.1 hypothetical protein [Photobacterium sp. ZSDE20]MDD1829390.1 hypothetical protein [Photobacterium sp. ZSDE20]
MSISVYETSKMHVSIGEKEVIKTFKKRPGYKKRFKREKKALQRLKGVDGFPQLISHRNSTVVMSRVAGGNQDQLSTQSLKELRKLVDNMLEAGVARHAIPERDLLIDNNKVSMVDFERVTLRRHRLSPGWLLAKKVTKFHLFRLISNHNRELLSESEKKELDTFTNVRSKLQKLKKVRTSVRKVVRSKSKAGNYTKKFESGNSSKD